MDPARAPHLSRERRRSAARRYRAEREEPERAEGLAHLGGLADAGLLTLSAGARRSDINPATVLAGLVADAAPDDER